ncbi:hypothetical protein FRX31_017063 [Thalictrum thalictroides]|uniref:Uncharacterized protein n=1 Tax=Thalictrum thalictroides TaxID=46969 RepID=A0A7J6W9T3_THATH|nr:hypothetical protein FRX31_017063 [Thalictrum thalictroides]
MKKTALVGSMENIWVFDVSFRIPPSCSGLVIPFNGHDVIVRYQKVDTFIELKMFSPFWM